MNMMYEAIGAKIAKIIKLRKEECKVRYVAVEEYFT